MTATATLESLPVTEDAGPVGSWLPTWSMVTTRFVELRRRRGLMLTLFGVMLGIPTIFLLIRVVMHAANPRLYGAAGGAQVYAQIVSVLLYIFGFIVAAMVGATAGSADLTDGMFRHLVITGRSRLALYLARIPAGLAIVVAAVAGGFTIVCVVCALAAPTFVQVEGAQVPSGLTLAGFETWAGAHPDEAICGLNSETVPPANTPCGGFQGPPGAKGSPPGATLTGVQLRTLARFDASHYGNYAVYRSVFRAPPVSLMIGSGLWLLLEATVGFIVGLGLGSLLGQRTVAIILMVVFEVILSPLLLHSRIPYLLNAQRGLVGLATGHLEPNGLSNVIGGGGGGPPLLPEATWIAVLVVLAWLVAWTVLGAWRMMTRDA